MKKSTLVVLALVITMCMVFGGPMPWLTVNADGNTYYVDNTHPQASDNNPGTQALPWVHCPGMTGWTGSIALQPGDTVYFNNAGIWETATGTNFLQVVGGVTYDGQTWGSGTRAVFRPTVRISTLINFRQDDPNIPTVVRGFELNSNAFATTGVGVNWPSAQTSLTGAAKHIEDIIVHNVGNQGSTSPAYGIMVSSGPGSGTGNTVRNMEIVDCEIYDINCAGIFIDANINNPENKVENVVVSSCDISDTGKYQSYSSGASGMRLRNHVANAVIEDNTIRDSVAGPGIWVYVQNSNFRGLENLAIQRNEIRNAQKYGIELYLYGDNEIDILNNTIIGNGYQGIRLTRASDGTLSMRVNGNTVAQSHDTSGTAREVLLPNVQSSVSMFEFNNNILVSEQTDTIPLQSGSIITSHSGNTYYREAGGTLVTSGGVNYTAATIENWEPGAQTEYPLAGRIIRADSPSQEDVQAAIDEAADGDTVIVPAGTATWVTITPNQPAVEIDSKGITLLGAGIDKTVIIDETGPESAVRVNGGAGKPFRISGFDFQKGKISIAGNARGWRIDHCSFPSDTFLDAIYPAYNTNGVIDHCMFFNTRVLVFNGNGHEAWKRPLRLGSADGIYVEDCEFGADVHHNSIDANNGGKYVFRYNTVINSMGEAHSLQKGWLDGTFDRAARSYEIYNNTFITEQKQKNKGNYAAIYLRGGTGVIHGNTVQNISGDPFELFGRIDNIRSYDTRGYPLLKADGTNPLDGNELANGYPALDQIGRSTDFGTGANYHPQTHEPLYIWDNTFNGNPGRIVLTNTGLPGSLVADHIQEGRDYFHTQHPSYTPYAYPHSVVDQTALILTWPTGSGQSFQKGGQYSIAWNATDADIVTGYIKLELYKSDTKIMDIAAVDASAGSYAWTVPMSLEEGGHYRIRIFHGAVSSVSQAFNIHN